MPEPVSPLLRNAIDSVLLGFEDFESSDSRRLISAVRNIHAGVLLLFKERLRQLSPPDSNEVLVKERSVPRRTKDGQIRLVGEGRKTANAPIIRQRFERLGIRVDWRLVRRVADRRNEIEHYVPQVGEPALTGVIHDACVLVTRFMTDELNLNPSDALGAETWAGLLKIKDVFKSEQQACLDSLRSSQWNSDWLAGAVEELACAACGSSLLFASKGGDVDANPDLTCRSCGEEESADSYVGRAVEQLSYAYQVWEELGADCVGPCPECGEESFVEEDWMCASCGATAERTCVRCASEIPLAEVSESPLCGYCAHVMSKDD